MILEPRRQLASENPQTDRAGFIVAGLIDDNA
jgi:hypothetical protein